MASKDQSGVATKQAPVVGLMDDPTDGSFVDPFADLIPKFDKTKLDLAKARKALYNADAERKAREAARAEEDTGTQLEIANAKAAVADAAAKANAAVLELEKALGLYKAGL